MMKLSSEKAQELLDFSLSFIGKRVTVVESISRSRDVGKHDRHFATRSSFSFRVDNVLATFSGCNLCLMGVDAQYSIALEHIVAYDVGDAGLEVVEHFEQRTERRTNITLT